MGFRDLAEVAGVREPKVLPIMGENVEFPGTVSAEIGARLMLLYQTGARVLAGDDDTARAAVEELQEQGGLDEAALQEVEDALLGPQGAEALDRLAVWGAARTRVISTLTVWHIVGQEAAEAVWEGKALREAAAGTASNRETRRRTGGSSSAGSGSATKAPGRSRTGNGASSGARKAATARAGS